MSNGIPPPEGTSNINFPSQVGASASISLKCTSSKFGLLCLPHGGDRKNLAGIEIFEKAAMENRSRWYEHADGVIFARKAPNTVAVSKSKSRENFVENKKPNLKFKFCFCSNQYIKYNPDSKYQTKG